MTVDIKVWLTALRTEINLVAANVTDVPTLGHLTNAAEELLNAVVEIDNAAEYVESEDDLEVVGLEGAQWTELPLED